MHLALISTSYPDREPGSEAAGAFVADFAEELARHVQVTVLAPARHARVDTEGALTVRRFAVPSLPLSLLRPANPTAWPAIIRTLHAGQRAAETLTAGPPIDHILALWALPSGYWARRIGKRHDVPYSCWALGSDIWSLGHIPLIRNLLRGVLRAGRHCFADGYLLGREVEALAQRPCEFLPSVRRMSACEPKLLRSAPPYRLAFLGRWHTNKGIDLLLEALDQLNDDDWRAIEEIRICGGGPLEEPVRTAGNALAAAGRPVTLRGYQDRDEAARLLTWADYVVLPSRIESIPVIFSDAIQVGCPLIATPVGDLPRLFGEFEVGILCAAASAAAITAGIRAAILHPATKFNDGIRLARKQFDLPRACGSLLKRLDLAP
ncbi:MAG: hypothetical protein B7Z66_07570 [Chromatiales bacterium 21-64-14]|nr:MAG: hypothetical protein B7Z66_07570 [Chromatiales bacterium 21-64-14]HQU15409.1 glycosyltransferase [Gammaproteobacteria bacterium]